MAKSRKSKTRKSGPAPAPPPPRRKRERRRHQYAALPVRHVDGRPEVMLITSRDTGRWIVPKGWPEKGMRPDAVAAMEAFEEAGVRGTVAEAPVASYRYDKMLPRNRRVAVDVDVFLLAVEEVLDRWPEMAERERDWVPAAEAAMRISDSGMKAVLLSLGAGTIPEQAEAAPDGVPELAPAAD
ncbi:MAG: NUDIX domain-containing protein [Alphaproteobacteria bacterium]|jgi:8-oxo-dGTP pyrophosphatase MutT (NUDIX family)|nr:NUDIX domain-containing protein [Alphaproteobacteria bacterium]